MPLKALTGPVAGNRSYVRQLDESHMRVRPVFSRFRELSSDALNVEYQVHTVQTDGEGTVEEILACARERGIGALAFTEHVRVATDWFPDFSSNIRERAAGFPEMRVFVGCETKVMDENGTLDISKEVLEASDIVLRRWDVQGPQQSDIMATESTCRKE